MDTLLLFETPQLIVRQYTRADAAALFRIMSDARVHDYTKERNHPWTLHRTEGYVNLMVDKGFRSVDCFHGAVIEKASGQLIGLCGLNLYEPNEPEIEFKPDVSFWGKGEKTPGPAASQGAEPMLCEGGNTLCCNKKQLCT